MSIRRLIIKIDDLKCQVSFMNQDESHQKQLPRLVDEKEDEEIASTESTFAFQFLTKLVDSMMKFGGYQFVAEYEDGDESSTVVRYIIKPAMCNTKPPNMFAASPKLTRFWSIYTCKLVAMIRNILVFYILIKQFCLCIVLYLRDRLADELSSDFRLSIAEKGECQVDVDSTESWKRLEMYNSWLFNSGFSLIAMPGIGLLIHMIISSQTFIFYYLPMIYLKARKISVDYLEFVLQPKKFLSNLNLELNLLIDELIENHRNSNFVTKSTLNDTENCYLSSSNNLSPLQSNRSKSAQTIAKKDDQYTRILKQIKYLRLVKPANVSSRWHRNLVKLNNTFVLGLFLIAVFAQTAYLSTFILVDLVVMSHNRLQSMSCSHSLGPNATFLGSFTPIVQFSSENHLATYKSHLNGGKNDTIDLLNLALTIESKYYLNRAMLWFHLLEVCVAFVNCAFWSGLWANFYLIGLIDKATWIGQIRRQTNECIRLSNLQKLHKSTRMSFNHRDELELIKMLTITLLNFELFRRKHSKFKSLKNSLFGHFAFFSFVSFSAGYIVARRIHNYYNGYVVIPSTIIVIMMDLYLISSSYLSKKIERLMRDMTNVVARCYSERINTDLEYPLQLWQRQMLTEAELNTVFASTFLGFYVTYKTIVAVNVYLILLWLLPDTAAATN